MTITFAINYYKNKDRADKLVLNVKEHYPDSTILLISDEQNRLKLPQFKGQWSERWLKDCLDAGGDVFIKLDPETICQTHTEDFPHVDIFGVKSKVWTYKIAEEVLFGAVYGITKFAANAIIQSNLLNDEKYADKFYSYQRMNTEGQMEAVSLQDLIMHDVAKRLNLNQDSWPDVFVQPSWIKTPVVIDPKYAFIHPVD